MKFLHFPGQNDPRDWRATIALICSIMGSIAFTGFSAALVWIVWRGGWSPDTAGERIDILGRALMATLFGSILVLVTLGFSINKRSIKLGPTGIEAEGGEDDADEAHK